jgi:hypothetical protein
MNLIVICCLFVFLFLTTPRCERRKNARGKFVTVRIGKKNSSVWEARAKRVTRQQQQQHDTERQRERLLKRDDVIVVAIEQ